jgi:hypothetical protein
MTWKKEDYIEYNRFISKEVIVLTNQTIGTSLVMRDDIAKTMLVV